GAVGGRTGSATRSRCASKRSVATKARSRSPCRRVTRFTRARPHPGGDFSPPASRDERSDEVPTPVKQNFAESVTTAHAYNRTHGEATGREADRREPPRAARVPPART